jgi:hypothetical protein
VKALAGGPLKALERVFRAVPADAFGFLELHFAPIANYPVVNGIEVLDEGPAR